MNDRAFVPPLLPPSKMPCHTRDSRLANVVKMLQMMPGLAVRLLTCLSGQHVTAQEPKKIFFVDCEKNNFRSQPVHPTCHGV
mmetsp:Transcript_15437/g.25225  ORF Transcript_15437/g.25225 Transcript_15437/m.25225 type:complete len:82 (+) Transcript_15437:347-592(+)